MRRKPVILFTTPVLRHPAIGGSSLRIENSIKALSQISDLYIYSRASLLAINGLTALSFYNNYCCKFYFAPYNFGKVIKVMMNLITNKITKRNFIDIKVDSEKNNRHFLKIAKKIKPDIIWLGYGNVSYELLKYIKDHSNYKVVVDTDSVLSRYLFRGSQVESELERRKQLKVEGKIKETEEKWGTRIADVTTAVSRVDAEYYQSLAQNSDKIHIFTNVIDLKSYKNDQTSLINLNKPCIYLAGSFALQSPMKDAANWMIDRIFPLVIKKIPQLHLYIIGRGSKESLADVEHPNITVLGEVKSVIPYLYQADVIVVPLRYESGTRFKILEAGACGRPVVSTSLGAEGLELTDGKDILIADTPVKFAKCIEKLCTNKTFALKIGSNLKKKVREKYDIGSLVKQGKIIVKYLTEQ